MVMVAVVLGIAACQKPADEITNIYEGDEYLVLVLNGEDIFEVGDNGELTDFGFNLVPIGNNSSSGKGVSFGGFTVTNPKYSGNGSTSSSARTDTTFPVEDFIYINDIPDNITIIRNSTSQQRTIAWGTTIAVPKGETFTVVGWDATKPHTLYRYLSYKVADQEFTVPQDTNDAQTYDIKATTDSALFTVNNVTTQPATGTLSFDSFTPSLSDNNGTEANLRSDATTPLGNDIDEDYYLFAGDGENMTLTINFNAVYTDSAGATHTIVGSESVSVSPTVAYEHYQYNFALNIDEAFNNNVMTNNPTDVTFTIVLDKVFQNNGSVDLVATYTATVQTYSEENDEGDFAHTDSELISDALVLITDSANFLNYRIADGTIVNGIDYSDIILTFNKLSHSQKWGIQVGTDYLQADGSWAASTSYNWDTLEEAIDELLIVTLP